MSSPKEDPEPRKLRRANEAVVGGAVEPPEALFDEFWREGELALLFGVAGAGKSLLAIEIAEALARGRAVEGLDGPTRRHNVLYVDLVLSDEQFAMRYSREVRGDRRRIYKFSAGLYRDRPAEGESLIEWLRECIVGQKISVVIIDDLSVVSQSHDGPRETLELMRELRRMTRELGVSILVLADSLPWIMERSISERDLRRSRVLCPYADSVFAIEHDSRSGMREVVQTRSQAGCLTWTHRSPARFTIAEWTDGFVGLELHEPELSPAQRMRILEIKAMHDKGMSLRSIARQLDTPKSTVARLYAKWKPELETKKDSNARKELPESRPAKESEPRAIEGGLSPDEVKLDGHDPASFETVLNGVQPPAAAGGSHLKPAIDAYGKEILIEKEDEYTGKPLIWYKRDSQGRQNQYRRTLSGIMVNAP